MRVERVAEHPRITKPFSEEARTALDRLGEEVDRILVADDVRLTMGGEPTFVSIDDFELDEWNTEKTRARTRGAVQWNTGRISRSTVLIERKARSTWAKAL